MEKIIDSFTDEFRFLSNFYLSEISIRDKKYATVEHAYQAFKAVNEFDHEIIRKSRTPGEAKRLGRKLERLGLTHKDWHQYKFNIMYNLIELKFSSHSNLADRLIATNNMELIEGNSWGDVYWGVYKGKGENMLGKILMIIRDNLTGVGF